MATPLRNHDTWLFWYLYWFAPWRHLTFVSHYLLLFLAHHLQKSESRKRNASVPNIPIASPSFARRQIGPTYQILTRRNISSPQIWRWVNFTTSSESGSNLRRRRHYSCFARILSLPMVSDIMGIVTCRQCFIWRLIDIMSASAWPFQLAALMSTVYEEQKDEDGFLYVQYSGESTFG